ncbi:MAG: SDR family NAD(P)-dependent oxidoreductase [Desulfobacteraceae bacterium]|nr:SDR family NAD(P)-dependent oxidoreductase [Desulfobacteraceae bacterium]
MTAYTFKDKHVLVTGAGGGMGSAVAKDLSETAARLVLTDRHPWVIEELIESLPGPSKTHLVPADLSVPGEVARLAREAVSAAGHIDLVFNIAGVGYFALMEEATEEHTRQIFEINTFSPLFLIKALLPHMKQRGGGRFVNIVSCAGRVPIPSVGVYGGSKSALAVMTNTMRLECQPMGIEIINIYPGTVDTAFEENALREGDRGGFCEPRQQCGEPRFDIARQVLKAAAGPPGEVWLERAGKWLSLSAIAMPSYVEKKLRPVRDRVISKDHKKKQRTWDLIQLESAISCNLKCLMCPWKDISRQAENRGIMEQPVWDSIRPHLEEIVSIDFTGGGEPLLQPNLADWISEAHQAGCETGILTNGTLLTESRAGAILDAGVNWVCFSIDGATAEVYEKIRVGAGFDKVCTNVAQFCRMRRGKNVKTMINFVMMTANFHQLSAIVNLAAELGVDQVNFKQCDVIRGEHGKGLGLFATEETKQIRQMEKELKKAKHLAKKLGLTTTDFPFTPVEQPVCEQNPTKSMFIRYDGTAAPCINLAYGGPTTFLGKEVTMPQVHYGRLPDDGLAGLWETDNCLFYRQVFEERIKIYDNQFTEAFIGGGSGSYHLQKAAEEAMPKAPEGCRVCHYLYNI